MAKILVVEDEDPLLEELVEWLTLEGYETIGAADGQEGYALALSYQPDLILSDVMMPNMNGHELLRQLRANAATALIPFVFLTALADRPDARLGMGLGADDYVTKPCTHDELLDTVQARLRKRQTMDTHAQAALDDLRSALVHVLPHEFRTPLMHIIGYADALEMDADVMSPTEVKEFANRIASGGQRLLRIAENYLLYAQLELVGVDHERINKVRQSEHGASSETIAATCREVATRHDRVSDLNVNIDHNYLQIAPESLNKMVYELLDNAFKFSKPGQSVEVVGTVDGEHYELVIADHGCGIPAASLKDIGAYKQFDRKLREQQGIGFGLVLAKRLSELFEGELVIQSEENVGTTVGVRLQLMRQGVQA